MPEFTERSSGYARSAYARDLRPVVRLARLHLPKDVDTIVGTGLSGALVVPHVGRRLGLAWGIVRKGTEASHATEMYEGRMGRRWALVDDFTATGATVQKTWDQIHRVFTQCTWREPWETEFAGVIQYQRSNEPWVSRATLMTRGWRGIKDPATQTRTQPVDSEVW